MGSTASAFLAALEKGYWRESDARVVIARQLSEGLSRSAFCAKYGLSSARLRRWKEQIHGVPSGTEVTPRVGEALRLAEVVLSSARHDGPPGAAVTVELPSGVSIRFEGVAESAFVVAMVRGLSGC